MTLPRLSATRCSDRPRTEMTLDAVGAASLAERIALWGIDPTGTRIHNSTMNLLSKLNRFRTGQIAVSEPARVFNAGGLPSVTYVDRSHLRLEQRVADALTGQHAFTIVSGPTKCGKSVVCLHMLGRQRSIMIQGGQVNTAEQFWQQIAFALNIPTSVTKTVTKMWSLRFLIDVTVGLPALIQKKLSSDGTSGSQTATGETFSSVLLPAAISVLKKRNIALIIDDFHYISKDVQKSIVRSLRQAVFDGQPVIILAVPHRASDAVDVEGEVEGRVNHVTVPRWSNDDLTEIARKGFAALKMEVPASTLRRMCDDAFGNPLLFQEMCFEFSRWRDRETRPSAISESAELSRTYDELVARKGLDRFDKLAQCVVGGRSPPMVDLRVGGQEALTMVLLSAVARGGPKPITGYDEIRDNVGDLTRSAPPSPEQVGQLCLAMANVISPGNAASLEWLPGTQELALTDPFLMFYMRWVLRDQRHLIFEHRTGSLALGVQPVRTRGRKAESE